MRNRPANYFQLQGLLIGIILMLIAFIVILLNISTINQKQLDQFMPPQPKNEAEIEGTGQVSPQPSQSPAINTALSPQPAKAQEKTKEQQKQSQAEQPKTASKDLLAWNKELNKYLVDKQLQKKVIKKIEQNQLILELTEQFIYSNSKKISANGQELLLFLGKSAKDKKINVRIEGNTFRKKSDQPLQTPWFEPMVEVAQIANIFSETGFSDERIEAVGNIKIQSDNSSKVTEKQKFQLTFE